MKESTERKEPRWKRRKDVRPQEIVQSALQLFVQQGYSATKVEQVARLAGVTPGTLYVYFENKEALLKAVVDSAMGPVFASATRQLHNFQGSASEMVTELIWQWWSNVGEGSFSGIPKLIIAEAQNYPEMAKVYVTEVQEKGRASAKQILDYGVQKGEFAIDNTEVMARLILSPMQFMSIYNHSLSDYDPNPIHMETFLDHLITWVLKGIVKKG